MDVFVKAIAMAVPGVVGLVTASEGKTRGLGRTLTGTVTPVPLNITVCVVG